MAVIYIPTGREVILMNKKMLIIVLAAVMAVFALGCKCEHEWQEADCYTPKTCTKCEEIEGEALGHDWLPAACETAETCSRCGETQGAALGHTWQDADCEKPKTCTACGATEGEALGHTWVEATCTVPKTCSVCAATEGEALGHTAQEQQFELDILALKTTVTFVCDRCGEDILIENSSLTSLIEGGRFIFTPQQFETRLGEIVAPYGYETDTRVIGASMGTVIEKEGAAVAVVTYQSGGKFLMDPEAVGADGLVVVFNTTDEQETSYLLVMLQMAIDPAFDADSAGAAAGETIAAGEKGKTYSIDGVRYRLNGFDGKLKATLFATVETE